MRTEYVLSDWQKERIAMIRNQIDMLQTELASIYATAKIRVIAESEEEADYVRSAFQLDEDDDLKDEKEWVRVNPYFGGRLIDPNGVVNIKPYEKEERMDIYVNTGRL